MLSLVNILSFLTIQRLEKVHSGIQQIERLPYLSEIMVKTTRTIRWVPYASQDL